MIEGNLCPMVVSKRAVGFIVVESMGGFGLGSVSKVSEKI